MKDGRTDKQTDTAWRHNPRLRKASRGKSGPNYRPIGLRGLILAAQRAAKEMSNSEDAVCEVFFFTMHSVTQLRCDAGYRRYGVKCAGCCRVISPRELVRRAPGDVVYHVDCFTCVVCGRQLRTGDHLYVLSDGRFVCRDDWQRSAAPAVVVDHEADGMKFIHSFTRSLTHSFIHSFIICVYWNDDNTLKYKT